MTGKIGFQGDSITKGTDYGGVTLADTFARLTGEHLGYAPENIINAGVSARTVVQMALDFKADIIDKGVTVCGVMGYFNDIQQGVSIPDFENALRSIAAQSCAHNIKLVFMTPPIWRGNDVSLASRRPYLYAMERIAAEVGVDFIDVSRQCSYDYLCSPALFDTWYVPGDDMHQSKAGHIQITSILIRQAYSKFWQPIQTPQPIGKMDQLTIACADYLVGGNTPDLLDIVKEKRLAISID